MYAIYSTVSTRNQDGTYTVQMCCVDEYFEHYEDAVAYLGGEIVTNDYSHEIEVLTVEEVC